MQMPANLALGDNVLHGLQMAAFSLCTHMVEGKREGSGVSSLYKGTNAIMGAPLSRLHLNLITSQSPHLPISSHCGLGLWHMDFGETQTFSS